jgi:hypothetical protein
MSDLEILRAAQELIATSSSTRGAFCEWLSTIAQRDFDALSNVFQVRDLFFFSQLFLLQCFWFLI